MKVAFKLVNEDSQDSRAGRGAGESAGGARDSRGGTVNSSKSRPSRPLRESTGFGDKVKAAENGAKVKGDKKEAGKAKVKTKAEKLKAEKPVSKEPHTQVWATVGILLVMVLVAVGIVAFAFSQKGSPVNPEAHVAQEQTVGGAGQGTKEGGSDEKPVEPGVRDLGIGETRSDEELEDLANEAEENGQSGSAEYYRSLVGTNITREDPSTDDAFSKAANGVISDLGSVSYQDFVGKYGDAASMVNESNFDYVRSLMEASSFKALSRYSNNTEVWLAYTLDNNSAGITIFVSRDGVVSDIQLALPDEVSGEGAE